MGEAFVARSSRVRIVLLVAAALLFFALSLWMAGLFGDPPNRDKAWIGWIGAPFFALAALMWGLRLREPADQIVIDDRGLTWRQWSGEHIPWSAIRGIDEYGIRRQTMFAVHLHDVAGHPPTRLMGKVAAAQAGIGRGHFSIIATGTDRRADELREALRRYGVDMQA
jgi:hypothetical protein